MIIVEANPEGIEVAVEIIKKGGVVVYPTDTAYGLGGIFNSAKVKSRVLKIKNRIDKKFPVICSDLKQVKKFFKLNKQELELGKKYWPGPLSIVVSDGLAVRVSKNEIAVRLASLVGKPLIATSANISGNKNLYDFEEVLHEFLHKKYQPDLMIDAGKLRKIKPSTLVVVENGEVKVLRRGPIKF